MKIKELLIKNLNASIDAKKLLIEDIINSQIFEDATNEVINRYQNGGRLYIAGNGGSAADAQHLAAEFCGRFYKDRKAWPSDALHCNSSYLTAVANDYSYDVVYSRMVEGIAKEGDILIGLSTSGNSKNIVKAFEQAKAMGVCTIGFTGAGGGVMKQWSDHLLAVPSKDTPRIQESHILIGHIICELAEAALVS